MKATQIIEVSHLATFSFRLNTTNRRTGFLESLGIDVQGDYVQVHNGTVVCDQKGRIIKFQTGEGGTFFFDPYDQNLMTELKIHTTHDTGIMMPLKT